jgi:hypothetical protein
VTTAGRRSVWTHGARCCSTRRRMDVRIRGRLDAPATTARILATVGRLRRSDQPGFVSNQVAVRYSCHVRVGLATCVARADASGQGGPERQVASWIGHEGACTRVFQGNSSNVAIPGLYPAPNAAHGLRISPAALPSGFFRRARASSLRHPSTTRNGRTARRWRRDDALA